MDCHRLTVVVHYIIPYGDTGIYASERARALEVDLYAAVVCESSPRRAPITKWGWGGKEE